MSEPIHIISLGAGVQSSTMALMAVKGELAPMPCAAVFADTQSEPASVYRWLDWLESQLPFPVRRVSAGNIEKDFLGLLGASAEKSRCGQPPFYVRNPVSDDQGGTLWRQCTKEYKLEPVRRAMRAEMERCGASKIVQWIGISLDEVGRMKPSGVGYIESIWPLVDLRMTRHDCLRWMMKHYNRVPPKSACRICPYMSNARWRQLKNTEPAEFAAAVDFDRKLRDDRNDKINGVKITGELFVHRSMIPLGDVDLSNDIDRGQGEMSFGNECEGMCGV